MKGETGLKFVSVVLAIVLWGYVRVSVGGVTQKVMSQLDLQVPLETRGAGSNLIPYEKSADTIKVTLRGDSSIVSDLREGLVRAFVDVGDMVSGSHWPEVQVLVPQGVQILSVEPKSVNVKLSAPMIKEVPVLVEGTGEPKIGFKALKPTFSPRAVRLKGPEALVSEVERVTSLVPVDGLDKTFSLTIHNLTPINGNGNAVLGIDSSIRITPRQINATIPIERVETVYSLPVLLDHVRVAKSSGYQYELEVMPKAVQVRAKSLSKQDLPKGVSTEPLTFEASSSTIEKEISLVPLKGITLLGDSVVKVRLIPKKVVSANSGTST